VSRLSPPLRVRGFAPLASSYALNELGDNLGIIALALLVLDRTGSALATTALFVTAKLLPALLAPVTTAALDRRRLGVVLPALYAAEGAAFAALALLAGAFWLPAVLALTLLDGLLALTARGLSRGAIATVLTPAGLLREGNAIINVVFAVMSVAGPLLAGLVVHQWSVAVALWADAASFAGIALLLALTAGHLPEPKSGPHEGWRVRVREGLAYVRAHPTAGRLIAGEAVAILFFTVTVPIEVVYVKESLGSTSVGFGALLAAWGVGILIGSALFARAGGRSLATMVLVSTAAIGIGYAEMAVAPTLGWALVGALIGGTGNGVQWVAVMTALQEAVSDDYQARAAGLLESAGAAIPGIGFVLGGALTSALDARVAYLVAAFGVAGVVLVWARKPIVPRNLAVSSS
jgi:MFS family permease